MPEKVGISSTLFYFIISAVVSLLPALIQWSGVVTLPVFSSLPLYILLNAIVIWSFWKWEVAQKWTVRKRRTGAFLIALPFLAIAGFAVCAQYQREHLNDKHLTDKTPRQPAIQEPLTLYLDWNPIEMLPFRVQSDSDSYLLEMTPRGDASSSVLMGDFTWPSPRIARSAKYAGYAGRVDITNPYPFPLWSIVIVFDLTLRKVTENDIPIDNRTESISHNLKMNWIGAKSKATVFVVNETKLRVNYMIPRTATALLNPEGDLKDVNIKRVNVFGYNDSPSAELQPSELHW